MQEASNTAMNMICGTLARALELAVLLGMRSPLAAEWAKPRLVEHALQTIGALRQEELEAIVRRKTRTQEVAARAKILMQLHKWFAEEMGGYSSARSITWLPEVLSR